MTTLPELVAAWAIRRPDAVAVCHGDRRLTYRELDAAADRLARRLRVRGVRPDHVVGVCLPRCLELPVTLLGVLKAGAAYLPLDPSYPSARLRLLSAAADPTAVVTNRRTAAVVDLDARTPVVVYEDTEDVAAGRQLPVRAENLAYVLYTSGSSGTPRPVAVTHRAVVNLVRAGGYVRFGLDEVFLHASSLSFDASTFEIWGALANGGRLVVAPDAHPAPGRLGEFVRAEGVTTMWLTAGLFHHLVAEGAADLRSLRQLVTGGDVVSGQAVRRALELLPGCRLVNGYGPTEATTFSTTQSLGGDIRDDVPIGRPIANVTAYVLDDDLRPAETGELHVAGAGLARGYLDAPGQTAAVFVPDPFAVEPGARMYRTGDRALRRPDGALEFLGRRDHQVKVRGFRVEPGEIEHALRQHPEVRDAVVVLAGDRLVGHVAGSAEPSGLREFLATRLPAHLVPAVITALPKFPLTANGKVDRRALPDPPPAAGGGRAPTTPAEHLLAGSLAGVLGVDQVGVDEEFFALGVDSLQVMRWLARLPDGFAAVLSVREVFGAATVATLATRLSRSDTAVSEPLGRGDRPLMVSFAQRQLWLLDQLHPGNTGYAVPSLFRLRGPLDVEALARAVALVVERHEPLRTVFAASAGMPRAELGSAAITLAVHDYGNLPSMERLRELVARDAVFDLARGPLVHARLAELGQDDHVLALTVHHIVCDGWSLAVLRRELGECYRAAVAGTAPALAELPVRFRDFVSWQRSQLSDESLVVEAAYWRAALAGAAELQLPTDRARPAVPGHRGDSVEFTLPAELTAALRELAREHGATLFMVSLAAFQTLLARYSGQSDFCVGVPVAGRERPELDGMVGHFVNLLVARADLGGDPAFADMLVRTRERTLDAFAHRRLPFDRLVELLGVERDAARHPLVQVVFAWQNTPEADLELPGIEVEPLVATATGTRFDLTFSVKEVGRCLQGTVEYDRDLYDPARIRRMTRHYATLLSGIVRDAGTRLSELPLLTPAEHRWLDRLGRRHQGMTRALGAASPTVLTLISEWVRRTPDAVAVSGGGVCLTYSDLDARADRLAELLVENGAGPERLVGVCLSRSAELPVALLAALKTGGAYLPLEPAYPSERLEIMLRDARPHVVLCTRETRRSLPDELTIPVVVLGDVDLTVAARPLPNTAHPDNLAYVMYTSGSTGRPKGVAVQHRGIVRLVTDEAAGRLRGEIVSQLAPFAFDASTFEIWGALANGSQLAVLPAGRNPIDELAAFIRAEGVTTCMLTTALFHELAARPADLRPLRQIVVGGDVMSVVAAQRVLATLPGVVLINAYGPTETVTFCSAHRLEPRADRVSLVPIDEPAGDTRLHVLDEALHRVPVGVPGELCVGGAGVSRGYLGNPALTAERFVPDPFGQGERLYRTGDRTRLDAGGVLEFLGRADHQVKIRGFRVDTDEIEHVLRQHPAVRDAVVTAVGEDTATRRLVASVVASPGVDLRGHLAERIPDFMVPSRISVLPALPMTPVGKPDRAAAAEALPEHAEPEPFDDAVTAGVAEIWGEVLGTSPTGAHLSFFDAGGNSLLLARVRSRVEDRFGRDVPLIELFRHPTVALLAGYLRALGSGVDSVALDANPVRDPGRAAGRDRMARLRALRTSRADTAGEQ
jgi:amino acid adenylation domain-containing protein